MWIRVEALGDDRLHQRVHNGLAVDDILLRSEEPMLAIFLGEVDFLLEFFIIKIEGIFVQQHLI